MPQKIISYGEALWDLLPEGPVLGGAPCNLAYRFNSLGGQAVLVSRLGEDDLGREARARISALGLNTQHLQSDSEHPTGTVEIEFDDAGQPDYDIITNVAYDFIEKSDALLAEVQDVNAICFGLLAQRQPTSRATLHAMLDATPQSAIKLLDINLRKDCYTMETIRASLKRATLLKINDDEARIVAQMFDHSEQKDVPAIARQLVEDWNLIHCVVTLAERGACCVSKDAPAHYDPGHVIEMVDPCGAGDAFTGAFLHGLLEGMSVAECLQRGNALGAAVATQRGATEPVEDATLRQFLSGNSRRVEDPELMAALKS